MKYKYPVILFVAFFLLLSLYHFSNLRRTLLGQTDQAPLSIQITDQSFTNDTLSISWSLDTPVPRSISKTGIYYSSISTPSALPISASPQAVGYNNFTPDYQTGQFFLPDSFSVNIDLSGQTDIIYYRAYAKLGNAHYWTPEKSANTNE